MTNFYHWRFMRLVITLLLSLVLSGCGFHLRNNYLLPDQAHSLSVSSFDDYASITNKLKHQLQLNGVTLLSPSSDTANLHIINQGEGSRTLSLYQNARAAEYELSYFVNYRVTLPEKGSKTFRVNITRSYLENPLAALAKSVEKDMILDEMQEEAAQQIIRQMARLQTLWDQPEADVSPLSEE